MNIESIVSHFQKLPIKQQKRFFESLIMLFDQELAAMSLRDPYRFVLDSNILMRVEDVDKGNFSETALASLCFFDYFRKFNYYKSDILITPVVFYEYCKKQKFGSFIDHWTKFQELQNLIEKILGVEIFFDGITNFQDAQKVFDLIEDDALKISEKLHWISEQGWHYDFIRKPGESRGFLRKDGLLEIPPLWAADSLYSNIETNYFNSECVALFLKDHIAFELENDPSNDLAIAKKYKDPSNHKFRKVLYLHQGNNLRGIADLEIFSLCNIRSQFYFQSQNQYHPASISFTFDKNLLFLLQIFSNNVFISEDFIGGESEDLTQVKYESMNRDLKRRTEKIENRRKSCMQAQAEFWRSVEHLFNFTF